MSDKERTAGKIERGKVRHNVDSEGRKKRKIEKSGEKDLKRNLWL